MTCSAPDASGSAEPTAYVWVWLPGAASPVVAGSIRSTTQRFAQRSLPTATRDLSRDFLDDRGQRREDGTALAGAGPGSKRSTSNTSFTRRPLLRNAWRMGNRRSTLGQWRTVLPISAR